MMIAERIKLATSENHNTLEKNFLLSQLTEEGISKETYIEILKKFYGYFSPIEQCVDGIKDLHAYLPDYAQRRKSSLILNDLSKLNYNKTIDICTDLPDISNVYQALGALYVLEGSTLGGRIIYKNVESALSIHAKSGASFFYGYGADTGLKWKSFQQALMMCENHPNEEENIIDAAVNTFFKLNEWIKV